MNLRNVDLILMTIPDLMLMTMPSFARRELRDGMTSTLGGKNFKSETLFSYIIPG